MKPLEDLSGKLSALSSLAYLAVLLGMIFAASSSLSAATNAPAWKNVRIIGGSLNAVASKMEFSGLSNDLYVATTLNTGEIENSLSLPATWNTVVSIYDARGQNVLNQIQPWPMTLHHDFMVNNWAVLDDGSLLYSSMESSSSPSPSLVLQKWQDRAVVESPQVPIVAGAYGDLPKLFSSVFSDGTGGFVMVGSFTELTLGNISFTNQAFTTDAYVAAFQADGGARWITNAVGNDQDTVASGCRGLLDNSVYFGGHTTSTQLNFGSVFLHRSTPSEMPFIAKYNYDGELEWAINPQTNSITSVLALTPRSDGDIICLGRTQIEGDWVTNLRLMRLDRTGKIKWSKPAGRAVIQTGLGFNIPPVLKTDASGHLYLGFNFNQTTVINGIAYRPVGGIDFLVAQFTSEGDPVWAKAVGSAGEDYLAAMALSNDSRLYVSGVIRQSALFDTTPVEAPYSHSIFLAELQNEFAEYPQILFQPSSQSIANGQRASFTVVVDKPEECSFQWFLNGTPIPGETNSTLFIPNGTTKNQGGYYVEIKNIHGLVRSKIAQLLIRGQFEITVTTYAGGNGPGYLDSDNPQLIQFRRPTRVSYLTQGKIVVADEFNHVIRLVAPGGATSTYAGNHEPGWVDAPPTSASFRSPIGLAVTPALDVYVADFGNDRIRHISAFGWRHVTTIVGNTRGYQDGPSDKALLNGPIDLVTDTAGNIYFAEFNNHTVRKLGTDGNVTTIAGNGFRGQADGLGAQAQFDQPSGIAIDRDGNLFVTEYSGMRIRKINRNGLVTTIAGSGARGFVDGNGTNALFNAPDGIALDPLGNLYVCEGGNHSIRKIDTQGNVVTIAGLGRAGFQNGNARTALFNTPGGIMWHPAGGLVVADTENHALRRIVFKDVTVTNDDAELLISLNPTLTIFGKVGATYRIEASEDPTVATNWVTLDSITLVNGMGMWCDSQPATRKWRYYRAVRTSAP